MYSKVWQTLAFPLYPENKEKIRFLFSFWSPNLLHTHTHTHTHTLFGNNNPVYLMDVHAKLMY